MIKRIFLILLTTLLCFNFAGGVSAVICIDAEGVLSMEMSIQNKCFCAASESGQEVALDTVHDDCRDIPLPSNVLTKQNTRLIEADKPLEYAIPLAAAFQQEFVTTHLNRPVLNPTSSIILII